MCRYELVFSPGFPHPSREQLLKDVQGVVGIIWFSKEKVNQELITAAGTV